MKILLKKDRRTIEFVDGIDKLNANDVMVNTLEVEFESPLLHGETLWVTFEKKDQKLEMTKPILATNEYKVTIPAGVIKVPGEWSLQLFIKRYDAVSKNLVNRQASITVTFTVENGLYVDDEMDLANNGSLASLYSIADKNTQELPLTLQHLMDFSNQSFYSSDGSLTIEKSGITYDDLMAKLKGEADTLTLADVVTTWKREGFNRDARVGDEFFGTARTKDDYIVGLNCKVIKVDESEERKGRPYWGVTDVEIIRYPDKEIALVSNITLEFSKTYAEIVALTNAGADVDSFPVDGLNRRPNIGERFFAVCTSGDKYGFGMTAEVVGFASNDDGKEYAVFKCIEVVLLAGSTIPKQVEELKRRMSKIDGGESESEGEGEGEGEEPTTIVPLVLNDSVSLSDRTVQVATLFSVDITKFNRKPIKNELFVAIAYDVQGSTYAIRSAVRSVSTDSVSCKITKVNILHDEERLSDTVSKAGDTMTGPLEVSNAGGIESVSYQSDRLHQKTGYSERSIFLPPIRENTPSEENPSAGYLDETLAARSELDPIIDKLDTVEEIAKGAQIAESFTSYEEMVEVLRGEMLGGSDGLTELKYRKGQSIYIETVDVPDLWVSRVEEDNFNAYLYTSDDAIVSALATNGYIQVGHYRLAQLENGKVNLPDYVKKDTKSSNGVYGKSAGNEYFYPISQGSTGDTIARRDSIGNIKVNQTPVQDNDAVSKRYADSKFVAKLGNTAVAANLSQAYVITPTNEVQLLSITEWGASPNTLAKRDSSGRLAVATPSGNNDAANKKYVDDAIANAGGGSGGGGTKLYRHDINGGANNFGMTIIMTTDTPFTTPEQIWGSVPNDYANPVSNHFVNMYNWSESGGHIEQEIGTDGPIGYRYGPVSFELNATVTDVVTEM